MHKRQSKQLPEYYHCPTAVLFPLLPFPSEALSAVVKCHKKHKHDGNFILYFRLFPLKSA